MTQNVKNLKKALAQGFKKSKKSIINTALATGLATPNRSFGRGRIIGGLTRSQRKNLKRRLKRSLRAPPLKRGITVPTNSWASTTSADEAALNRSIANTYQTLFFPECGVFRGMATGSQASALCTVTNSFDLNGFTSTNNVVTMFFSPGAVSTSNFGRYIYSTVTSDPTSGTAITHPFGATNPATDYRCVSCTVRIIPVGALLNQGGEGVCAYTTNKQQVSWDRPSIDNCEFMLPFKGTDSMVMHWVPNTEETMMLAADAQSVNTNSCLVMYLAVPPSSATASTYRVEYTMTLEYIPLPAYKIFVQRCQPTTHPSTFYHINQLVQREWNPLVVCPLAIWEQKKLKYDSIAGGHVTVTAAGLAGNGGITYDQEALDAIRQKARYINPAQIVEERAALKNDISLGNSYENIEEIPLSKLIGSDDNWTNVDNINRLRKIQGLTEVQEVPSLGQKILEGASGAITTAGMVQSIKYLRRRDAQAGDNIAENMVRDLGRDANNY